MLQVKLKAAFAKAVIFNVIALIAFSYSAKAGGDIFQVYLNNSLILKQFVIEPLTLKDLRLQEAKPTDKLVVHYSHCGKVGKARSIAIRDEKGKVYKEWKFDNSGSTDAGMSIPVKEILDLQAKNKAVRLSLHYSSQELPKGRMLAGLPVTRKGTT